MNNIKFLLNFVMYRPPKQNNEEQVNIDEVLDKLKGSMPKIPGLGKGSPVFFLVILIILAIFWASPPWCESS